MSDSGFHASDCDCELPFNELSLKPKDAIAETVEHAIAARIGSPLASMVTSIDFNDEPHGGSDEVSDVPTDRNLPTEPHSEPAATDLSPELLLRGSEIRAHLSSTKLDEFLMLRPRLRE